MHSGTAKLIKRSKHYRT